MGTRFQLNIAPSAIFPAHVVVALKNTEQVQHCEFIALWQDLKAEVARRQATLIRPLAGSPEQGLSILNRQLRLRSVLRMWSALVYSKLCQLSSGSQLLLKLHGPRSKAVPDKSHLPGGPGACCLLEAVRLQPLAMPTQEGSCTQSPTSPREYDKTSAYDIDRWFL